MTIESTRSTTPTDKPAQSGTRPPKSRAGEGEEVGAGGFLALMAAMGDDVIAIQEYPVQEDSLADLKLKEALVPVNTAQDATNLEAIPFLTAYDLPSSVAAEAAAMVLSAAGPLPASASEASAAIQPQPQPQSQRPKVTLDAVGVPESKDDAKPVAVIAKATGLRQVALSPNFEARPEAWAAITKEGAKPASGIAKTPGLLQDALSATSTLALQNLSSESAGGHDAKGQESKFLSGLEAFKTLSKDASGQLEAAVSLAPALTQEKTPERAHAFGDLSKGPNLDAPAPLGVLSTGAGPSISTLASPQMSAPLEVAVAEKVAYWIGQDVQSAEMQLDGIGKDAVQVSISMVGNEAQVTFRTDEAVTRDALQAASGQLKDMLSREGVFLSGVSVGQSGTGGAQDGQRQTRQGHRQVSNVTASVEAAVAATRPARGPTGRNLDLFV